MALWFVSMFETKFCESMQELLHYRFLQSLKQKPSPRPCKSLNVEFQSSINSSLLSPCKGLNVEFQSSINSSLLSPCKGLNVEFQSSINSSLLSPFPDEIVTRQILACLHLHKNPFMLWQLCCVNKAWHAFVSQSLERQALEVVKSENPSYHQTVKQLRLKRCSFLEWL